VEQLGLIGGQAGLDVAQLLAPCELHEGHDAKQVRAAQRAHAYVAPVPLDDLTKGLSWDEFHHLREQRLAHVRASPRGRSNPQASQISRSNFKSWTQMKRLKPASALALRPLGIE
jgi:Ser/Thr protein kinase RdoA (MazF antagonist)